VLDTSITGLNRFIHLINESNVISDMTVKDPPIENVVKEMYSRSPYKTSHIPGSLV